MLSILDKSWKSRNSRKSKLDNPSKKLSGKVLQLLIGDNKSMLSYVFLYSPPSKNMSDGILLDK